MAVTRGKARRDVVSHSREAREFMSGEPRAGWRVVCTRYASLRLTTPRFGSVRSLEVACDTLISRRYS